MLPLFPNRTTIDKPPSTDSGGPRACAVKRTCLNDSQEKAAGREVAQEAGRLDATHPTTGGHRRGDDLRLRARPANMSEGARIKSVFDEIFDHWGVQLPESDLNARSAGCLRQRGGHGLIRYAFGKFDGKDSLEFYSFHRIQGDYHARIHARARWSRLPSWRQCSGLGSSRGDATANRRARRTEQEADRGARPGGPARRRAGNHVLRGKCVSDHRSSRSGRGRRRRRRSVTL